MKTYSRFYSLLAAATFLPLLPIGWFNSAVDPYEVFNRPLVKGFNKSKPIKHDHERLFKAVDVTRIKPKTILLGSSRTRSGLNPSYSVFSNYQPAYNLGLPAGNMYEVKRYFQHALANQPDLKLVVLEIDSFSFNIYQKNTPDFSENRLEKTSLSLQDVFSTTISIDAFLSSITTATSNATKSEVFSQYVNGMLDYGVAKKPSSVSAFTTFLNRETYSLSQDYLKDFEYIVKTCQERGIELKIFISPTHVTYLENIRVAGYWQMYEQWKREIVKITPVWDFSGYNSITTEHYSDKTVMKNYRDSSHYSSAVGKLILNRMFNYEKETVPADFGVLITPANIESQLAKINAEREAWAKNNPDDVKFVQNLKLDTQTQKE